MLSRVWENTETWAPGLRLRRWALSAGTRRRLAAIRKLATAAAENALLDSNLALGNRGDQGVKREGVRAGN